METDLVRPEPLVENAYRLFLRSLADVAGGEVLQSAVIVHGYQIHAERNIVRSQLDAHGSGL